MTDPTMPVTGGVDTHKDTHVAAVLNAVGVVLGTAEAHQLSPTGERRHGEAVGQGLAEGRQVGPDRTAQPAERRSN